MKSAAAVASILALLCPLSASAAEEIRDCDVCPALLVVPAGEFTMGSDDVESSHPDEKPAHRVRIGRAFAIGKFEVTFEQWDACVADRGCPPLADEDWGRGTRPVINVDYPAARGYAAWLTRKTGKPYRLPSEAEWEYAARAGTTTAWHWGTIEDGIGVPAACRFANSHDITSKTARPDFTWLAHPCEDGYTYTAPVGSFEPNAFGLHDMLGNVREWVEDCEQPYRETPTDGSPAVVEGCEKRIARGGSWLDGPTWVRSAYRYALTPRYVNYVLGLRVARDLP